MFVLNAERGSDLKKTLLKCKLQHQRLHRKEHWRVVFSFFITLTSFKLIASQGSFKP